MLHRIVAIVGALFIAACMIGHAEAQTATPTLVMMGPGWYEESASQIAYSGTGWVYDYVASASGGAYKVTGSADSAVQIEFLGSGFTAYFCRAVNRGVIQICVDSDCYQENHYASTTGCKWGRTFDSLSYGLHSVSITRISGDYTELDALHIWGWEAPNIDVNVGDISIVIPTSEVVLNSTLPSGSTYQLSRSASFGDMAIVLSISLLAIVGVMGIVVKVFYGRSER